MRGDDQQQSAGSNFFRQREKLVPDGMRLFRTVTRGASGLLYFRRSRRRGPKEISTMWIYGQGTGDRARICLLRTKCWSSVASLTALCLISASGMLNAQHNFT